MARYLVLDAPIRLLHPRQPQCPTCEHDRQYRKRAEGVGPPAELSEFFLSCGNYWTALVLAGFSGWNVG
jgi:hypothetical protein